MKRRVTMKDVALSAGVGIATVDRVLNRRAPVSKRTAARVLAAAETLGYHAQGLLRQSIEDMAPMKTLGFILQKRSKWFYRTLAAEIESAVARLQEVRGTVEVTFVESLSPDDLSQALLEMRARTDAVALVSVDHPLISDAIRECAASEVPVLSLLSPLSSTEIVGHVGIDGRKAGRTAGWAMSRLAGHPGVIGILIGSHRYLGHEAMEIGFRSYMREFSPGIVVREPVVYMDDGEVAYEATAEILRAAPGLTGLYHCGGGVGGVVKALQESERGHEIVYICHEKSPTAVRGLLDGTVDLVIANSPQAVATAAARAMTCALLGNPLDLAETTTEFQLFTAENL